MLPLGNTARGRAFSLTQGEVVGTTVTGPGYPTSPGERGSLAGGPWCQLQEMVRGMLRPLEPLGCLCSMECLRSRKEEACGFFWASLPPLLRTRYPAPERLYVPFTPSSFSPFLPPIIYSTVGCPLWARHYTELGGGGVPLPAIYSYFSPRPTLVGGNPSVPS